VDFATTGSFGDKNAGTGKTVNVSGALSGTDAGNYTLVSNTSTTADITPASLSITVNNAAKPWNGRAYAGGNGVSYSGFVAGEGASVLSGTLAYGGSAQGASTTGRYALSASGLASGNYLIQYHDGTLAIGPALELASGGQIEQATLAVLASGGGNRSGISPQRLHGEPMQTAAPGNNQVPLRIAVDYLKVD
jgi:hypothetical protein